MKVWVEGYRSHNLKLNSALHNAAIWYCTILLGTRMAKNIELDIKLTRDLKKKEKAYVIVIL